jgi:hypothetical protein
MELAGRGVVSLKTENLLQMRGSLNQRGNLEVFKDTNNAQFAQ